MHRTGKRLVAAAGACALPFALAFHTGQTFDQPPGAGGGGGLYYTGSPRERGWECSACHIDPPKITRVRVISDPPELFEQGRWIPGVTYAIHAEFVKEHFGRKSGISNHNGMAVTIVHDDLTPAGRVGGFAAGDYFQRGDNILATAGLVAGQTAWDFSWTAPDTPDEGAVSFYFGFVDGNGAKSASDDNTTDPYGDDVAMTSYRTEPIQP